MSKYFGGLTASLILGVTGILIEEFLNHYAGVFLMSVGLGIFIFTISAFIFIPIYLLKDRGDNE